MSPTVWVFFFLLFQSLFFNVQQALTQHFILGIGSKMLWQRIRCFKQQWKSGNSLLMETQGTAYFLPDFSPVAWGPFPIPFTLVPPAASLFVSVGKP